MGGSGGTLVNTARNTYRSINDDEALRMAGNMLGTTGDEETELYLEQVLDGYEGTSGSFVINAALRDGDTSVLSARRQEIIKRMDDNMRPLPDNINVIRNVGNTYMSETLGIYLNDLLTGGPNAIAKANSNLRGKVIQEKNFMSTSYDASQNVFTTRLVHLNIQATKGTKAIFGSRSNGEAEVILGRNTRYVIRNIELSGNGLNINVTTLP